MPARCRHLSAFSPVEALRQVMINRKSLHAHALASACEHPVAGTRHYHACSSWRSLEPAFRRITPNITKPNIAAAAAAAALQPNPDRDEGIMSRTIQVVDPATSALKEQSLASTLAAMDRKRQFLVQVTSAKDGNLPVCKVMLKRDVFEAERKRQIAAHNADHTRKGNRKQKRSQSEAAKTKIIEVGWNIGQGDLERSMKRLNEFLEKGLKVEIAIRNKKRGKTVLAEEAERVLEQVKSAIDHAAGKVTREEGAAGGLVRMLVEPPDLVAIRKSSHS